MFYFLAFAIGYDHHAIFDGWANATEAYVIHHPVGRRTNPPSPKSQGTGSRKAAYANLALLGGCVVKYGMSSETFPNMLW